MAIKSSKMKIFKKNIFLLTCYNPECHSHKIYQYMIMFNHFILSLTDSFSREGPMPRRMFFKIGVTFVIGIGIILFYLLHLEVEERSIIHNSKEINYSLKVLNNQNYEMTAISKNVIQAEKENDRNRVLEESKNPKENRYIPVNKKINITPDDIQTKTVGFYDVTKSALSPVYERYGEFFYLNWGSQMNLQKKKTFSKPSPRCFLKLLFYFQKKSEIIIEYCLN